MGEKHVLYQHGFLFWDVQLPCDIAHLCCTEHKVPHEDALCGVVFYQTERRNRI